MSNNYFNWPGNAGRFERFDTVRSEDANNALDEVSAGFDLMPSPVALQSGAANYAADIGAVNAYAVTLSSQITSYAAGLVVRFRASAANTGASTLAVNGLTAKSIVRPNGSVLVAGDILAGQIVEVFYDSTGDKFQLPASATGGSSVNFSGTAGGTVDLLTGASIASAATVNLNGATGNFVHITGTTNITAVTLTRGPRDVIFDGALTLTHHVTNLNLPTGANITTAAGDRATFWGDGTTVYCTHYTRANGISLRAEQFLHVRDEKASGTAGGDFNNGAWRTRTLNTEKTNTITGASLAANQITLPAGSYYIEASAPAVEVGVHKAKLYNVTDAVDILVGTNASTSSSTTSTDSFVSGRFTLASTKVVELQHQSTGTIATSGFGRAASFSVVEVYADVKITRYP